MVVILMQLRHKLDFTAAFLNFVLRASKSAAPEVRCNVAVILMSIAKHSEIAMDTLKRMTSDADESVRHNALHGLSAI